MRHRLSRKHRPERDPLLRSIVRTAFLGAFLLMLGCTSWEPVPVNTVPSPSATLRVHLRDGTSVIVRDAVVRTDSIVGIRSGSMPPLPVAVALAQVQRVEVAETDRRRNATVLINVGILALAAFALVFLVAGITGYHEGT